MILAAFFVALLAVLSKISIPFASGVPVTLQTFGVALCGLVLGTRKGLYATLAYLLLGAVGVPVFSGASGGFGVFAGPTGGFLIGFLSMVALCGKKRWLFLAVGLAACHLPGVLWFSIATHAGFARSFAVASAPYLLKDAASIACACLAARTVEKGLRAARFPL